MTIPIKLMYSNDLNCIFSLLISVAAWRQQSYELVFIETWGFTWKEPDPSFPQAIGIRLNPGVGDFWESYQRYTGMQLVRYPGDNPEEIHRIIQNELSAGSPSIVFIDQFWYPFGGFYNKLHTNHGCLVVGMDDSGNLICNDAQPRLDEVVFPKSDFLQGCQGLVTFRVDDDNQPRNIDWQTMIKSAIDRLYRTQAFDAIRSFGGAIVNDFNWSAELEEGRVENLELLRLVWQPGRIGGGRKLFGMALQYIGSRLDIPEILTASKDMESIAAQWNTVKSLLLKFAYAPHKTSILERTSHLINEIADREEDIAQKLLQLTA